MSKIIKRISILWICGNFALLLFFHPFIFHLLTRWTLQTYSVTKWGKSLEYETFGWNGNQLIIQKPKIHEIFFSADSLTLKFHINWLTRKIDVDVKLDKPFWKLKTPPDSDWKNWERLSFLNEKWVKFHPTFEVKEGSLAWISNDALEGKVYFDLYGNNQEGGKVKLYFDASRSNSQYLTFQSRNTSNGMEVCCNCEEIDCCPLATLVQFLGVGFSPSMSVTSGILQGHVKAIFPQSQRPFLEGEMSIANLAFSHQVAKMTCLIGKAKWTLEKNEIADDFNDQVPTIMGELTLLSPSSISYISPHDTWQIDNLEGKIQLDHMHTASVDLKASVTDSQQTSSCKLQGKTNLNALRSPHLDLTLFFSSLNESNSQMHFSLSEPQSGKKCIKIQLAKLSHIEMNFLLNIFAIHWPLFKEVRFEGGEFSGLIEANLTSHGMKDLHIKQFQAFDCRSRFKPWNAHCQFGQVRGDGKIDLENKNIWESAQGGVHFEDGEVKFDGFPYAPFSDIQAHFLVQNGLIKHSLVTLEVGGLKGKMDVDWGKDKHLLICKLDGTGHDFAELIPLNIQENFRQHFSQDRVTVVADMKNFSKEVEFEGTLHFQEKEVDQTHLIHFGCKLKKLNNELSTGYIPSGWFYARKLPLQKFLSPFIFRNEVLHLSGEIEVKGSFDHCLLDLKYEADHVKIENEYLLMQMNHLHSPIPGQLIGSHQFVFKDHSSTGNLPIQHCSYLEKKSGLFFQDIQGMVKFRNKSLYFQPIEAHCEGISFLGDILLDYNDPSPGVFSLKIQCPFLWGKVSHVQNLLSRLMSPSILEQIPLEGEFTAKDEGLKLNLEFIPKEYSLSTEFSGAISNGFISLEGSDIALKGIDMDVSYKYQEQLLTLKDIQGTLLIGKPKRVEEYQFNAEHIRFFRDIRPDIDFDMVVKDRSYELIRLVGFTKEQIGEVKSLHLNQELTHLSGLYPHIWQCEFKDWSSLEKLECCFQFDIGYLLHDLARFRQTGLLFLSNHFIDKLSQFLPLEGTGFLSLRHGADQRLMYEFEGSHITQGDASEHLASITGYRQDKKWIVDQLKWDAWNGSAEFEYVEDRWKIPHLGINAEPFLLLGFEGDFIPDKGLFSGRLKFCEIDLEFLADSPLGKSLLARWSPKGKIKMNGGIEWDLFSQSKEWEGLSSSLQIAPANISIRGYPLQISHPFLMDIKAERVFRLQNLRTSLAPDFKESSLQILYLEYSFFLNAFNDLQLTFQIPSGQLKSVTEKLCQHFPESCDVELIDKTMHSKQSGQLKGTLTLENKDVSSPSPFFLLRLEDGRYSFKKREWGLKNFEIRMSGNTLNFSGDSQLERLPFQIVGQCNRLYQQGDCFLKTEGVSRPLHIKWDHDSETGIAIRSLKGEFGGCDFDLVKSKELLNNSPWMTLEGKVDFDVPHLCTILPTEVVGRIQRLKIASRYSLLGQFKMNFDLGNSLLETIFFDGKLSGKEVILKGYQVQHLEADLEYTPGRLDIQDLTIIDPAITIKAENLIGTINRHEDQWDLFIPQLTIKNLKPLLLRNFQSQHLYANSKFRSLQIKRLELNDVSGKWNDLKSWQASGNLHFLNPTRKNFFHPLLAIPAEIILRLGLDPQVLNPVTGTIYFTLKGERFYLTRFKDVYSEGRGSKFYLAQSQQPPWMDFNGNLFMQIRMKQYNLIFKLAELFIFSVTGNITKPIYALQKHSKSSRKASAIIPFETQN